MVRDRMPELRAYQNNSTTFGKGFLQDVHIQIYQNKKLKEVLDKVEGIRDLIQLIAENTAIVRNLHNNVLSYTNKDIQKELENRMYTISQTSFRIQQKLREMSKEVVPIDDLTITSAREGPIHIRIKALQYTTMLKLFSQIMEEYNNSMLRYNEKCRLLLHQQKLLIRKHITSEELEKLLDVQENNIFVDNILEDSKLAKQQLSDIQNRHNEIIKIEKSLAEVRDMFTEMAFLIEKQGEQINNVEYFAGKTADNIDSGRIDLKKAEKKNQRYRKRKIKLGIIISIIIIIFLIIIILL
ncbi:syntaxin-1A [Apis mellifera caucasica]|uniref:Syntaxin-1A n=1 Tax=Apis mellifera TaxID=7460 RepID=A0A7M7LMJ6_APIME|nr:syntaxin-1A [Apis mellifera]KAG6800181.1 syntaxin-1A [Apis mellifera caucasica]KAG9433197.1 syntaxin-1A [Apis mellifera carnica]|eukprot:XP_006560957.3 syntaxin-1A [Apis mellifera]